MEPVYEIGQKVFVVVDCYEGDPPGALTQVIHGTIVRQEWWDANKDHPVYYDIADDSGKIIGVPCTGNWYFGDIYPTREEAENSRCI